MASSEARDGFAALATGQARLALVLRESRILMLGAIVVLSVAGWSVAAGLAAGHGAVQGFSSLGPGMGLLDALVLPAALTEFCRTLLAAQPGDLAGAILAAIAMWGVMTFAMMLPAAAPLIVTYAEIADTAAHKGARVVSVFVVAAGYMVVWLAFAVAAALAQMIMSGWVPGAAHGAASLPVMAGLFIVAGAFQFSDLKQACLARCRRPFTFLFARWSDRVAGVFRLGLEQGAHCLGCCWALMLLMFAVGVMNLFAMALIAVLMIAEQTVRQPNRLRIVIGVCLIAIGGVLGLMSIDGFLA